MAEIINLRQVRKAKTRDEKAKVADRNRAAFGQTKVERHAAEQRRAKIERHLDGARRDGHEPGTE